MSTIAHKEFKDGMAISCKNGDTIAFELDSNQTTGYQWKVSVANDGRVNMKRCDYVPSNPDVIGSGGKHFIELVTRRVGKTKVLMENCAPSKQRPTTVLNVEITE